MLCEKCQKLFDGKWTRKFPKKGRYEEIGQFHSDFAASEEFLQQSCEFCSFLSACLTPWRNAHSVRLPSSGVSYEIHLYSTLPRVEHGLQIRSGDEGENETVLSLSLIRESDLLKHNSPYHTVSTMNTRPESCAPQIQAWIDRCTNDHDLCTRLRCVNDAKWHPTRLIDVSLDTGGPSVRLEDDPEKLSGANYNTLSYCWGPKPHFLKLQSNNYSHFKSGILISSLPKTLQDSVVLTRALGIRYIWIDALCIVQDSVANQDWLQEALRMSNVYGRSYINIAASSSSTAEGGLFRERDPVIVNGVSLNPQGAEKEGYVINRYKDWFFNFQFEPLNLRAWALQERRLSSRTIHFTDTQVYWECSNLCASEVYPNGKPWDVQWSHRQNQIAVVRDTKQATLEERHDTWWWLVWEYSKGKLSVESDRLVAIAGLAKSLDVVPGDGYVAGQWTMDMPHGLTWWALGFFKRSTETFCAPTWSWASVPDGITIAMPGPKLHPRADVIELRAESNRDRFGPVNGGFLRLRGRMCKAFLTLNPPEGEQIEKTRCSLQFSSRGSATKSLFIHIDGSRGHYENQAVFCVELEAGGLFFKPTLQGWKNARRWTGMFPQSRGLLLRPTGRRKGEFQRIGCYEEDFQNWQINIVRKPKKVFCYWRDSLSMEAAFRRRDISSEFFEDLDSANRYTIRIV